MRKGCLRSVTLLLPLLGLVQPVAAELPMMEKPWPGMFAVYEGNGVQVTLNGNGKILISPILKNGMAGAYANIPVLIGIEEVLPNGKVRFHELEPASLKSEDETTTKFEETTVTGKIAGGAEFEFFLEQKRGVVFVGGRVTAVGPMTRNPLRFAVNARVLNFYGRLLRNLKNDTDAFEDQVGDDYLEVKRTDGKRKKFDLLEVIDTGSDLVTGPGCEEVEIGISPLGPKTFVFTAEDDSSMRLSNRKGAPLHKGFVVQWSPEVGKEKDGEARFVIKIK